MHNKLINNYFASKQMFDNIKIVIYQCLIAGIIPIINFVLLKYFGPEIQVEFFEKKLFLDMTSTFFSFNIIVLPTIMVRNNFKAFANNLFIYYISLVIFIIFIGIVSIPYYFNQVSSFDMLYILGMFISHCVAGAILFAKGLIFKQLVYVSLPTILMPPILLFFPIEFIFGITGIVSSIISLYFLARIFRYKRINARSGQANIYKIFKLNFVPWLYTMFQAISVYFAYEFISTDLDVSSRSNLTFLIILQTIIVFPVVALTPKFFREYRGKDPVFNISLLAIITIVIISSIISQYALFICATLLLIVARMETSRALADNKLRKIYISTRYFSYIIAMTIVYFLNNYDLIITYFGLFCLFEILHRISHRMYSKCSML